MNPYVVVVLSYLGLVLFFFSLPLVLLGLAMPLLVPRNLLGTRDRARDWFGWLLGSRAYSPWPETAVATALTLGTGLAMLRLAVHLTPTI